MEDNKPFNRLEEQLSNTLKAVDKFHAEMQVFKEYTIVNNKVVNAILHKLDDHAEQLERSNKKFDVLMAEMAVDRKLRDAQFKF